MLRHYWRLRHDWRLRNHGWNCRLFFRFKRNCLLYFGLLGCYRRLWYDWRLRRCWLLGLNNRLFYLLRLLTGAEGKRRGTPLRRQRLAARLKRR
jgi:hypothetical protein